MITCFKSLVLFLRPRPGRPGRLLLAGLLLLLAVPAARAQVLSGRLVHRATETPVAGALVILVDSADQEVARGLSTSSGGFSLAAPAPGLFRIWVVRIGFARWTSAAVALQAGEHRTIRYRLDDEPIRLPDFEIAATRDRCGVRPEDGDILGRLLGEAEKALALTEQTLRDGRLRFRTETWTVRPSFDGAPGERETRTTTGLAAWPVASAPPESLATWGFIHEGIPYGTPEELAPERGPVYYAPDARVLFSLWFLESHCFSVAQEDSMTLVLRFEPHRARAGDIRGKLLLDRATLSLRRLEYRYTGLPGWVPRDSAGGELRFRVLRTGAWIVDRWVIRAPIPLIRGGARGTRLFGFAESGGRVLEVRYGRNEGDVERLSLRAPGVASDPPNGIQVAPRPPAGSAVHLNPIVPE